MTRETLRETPSKNIVAPFAIMAGCVALALLATQKGDSSEDVQPQSYSVQSFTYDAQQDIGHLSGSETFKKDVGNTLTLPEVKSAMEALLDASDYEFSQSFPDIPSKVWSYAFTCNVVSADPNRPVFNLDCIATPSTNTVIV